MGRKSKQYLQLTEYLKSFFLLSLIFNNVKRLFASLDCNQLKLCY